MPALDPKSETILHAFVQGGSKDQSAAWLVANPNSKAKPASVNAQASRFFAQVKVQSRLAELHLEVVNSLSAATAFNAAAHDANLEMLRDEALKRGQIGAAITAEVKRGELHRMYVKQTEVGQAGDFDDMSKEELKQYIDERAKELKQLRSLGDATRH